MERGEILLGPSAEARDAADQGTVDVLVLVAVQDELEAVLALGEGGREAWSESRDSAEHRYFRRVFCNEAGRSFEVAAAWVGEMGKAASAIVGGQLLASLDPACLAMCGVCAGYRKKVRLGDVIVADQLWPHDEGKLVVEPGEEAQFSHSIRTFDLNVTWKMDASFLAREIDLGDLAKARPQAKEAQTRWLLRAQRAHEDAGGPAPREHPDRKNACPGWTERLKKALSDGYMVRAGSGLRLTASGRDWLDEDELLYPESQRIEPPIEVHLGAIATGSSVVEDPEIFERLRKFVRTTIGLEMEGTALADLARRFGKRAILVKAVQDHADHEKDDSFRAFACRASATFLLAFLQKYFEPEARPYIPVGRGRPKDERIDPFLARVERVARLRHAGARIARREAPLPFAGTLEIEVQEGAIHELRVISALDKPITNELLSQYIAQVVEPLRRRDPYGGKPTLVHAGEPATYTFQSEAARRGVLLKSFSEYQGLLDFKRYLEKQTERLEADAIYPPWLYVEQPARVSLAGAREERRVESALSTLWQELDTPLHPRFALVLGDFGAGKTFLLHELARRMAKENHPLVPVLVEMSKLEKAQTLKTLLAQHFAAADMGGFDFAAFQYMLAEGRIALLFDGFDELALRLPYDRAVQHFETVLQAAHGVAKVVVTSRRQHFLTDHDVKRALAEQAERTQGYRFFLLERFEEPQIRRFLQNTLKEPAEAEERYRQLDSVKDLLGLSHNPRMLGFIAKIDKEKLRRAEERDEEVTAAKLYEWLVDQWLDFEYDRANPPGAPRGVSRKALRSVMSDLALVLWDRPVKTVEIHEIRECVVSRMKELGEPAIDEGILTHLFGSGSLFVRDRDGVFQFVHRSVLEWLVAEVAAREVVTTKDSKALALDEMSALMADFFVTMGGKEAALGWASGKLAGLTEGHVKKNATLVVKRIEKIWGPLPEVEIPVILDLEGQDLRGGDYSGVDWRGANLSRVDLRGATLVMANLRGASLSWANLSRADFNLADLSGVDLTGADLSFADLELANLAGAGPIAPARLRGANLLGAEGIPDKWHEALIAEGAVPPALREVEPMFAAASGCLGLAYSPDGSMLAAAHVDGTVWLVDVKRGKVLRVLLGHKAEAQSVVFSPDGKTLASASSDKTIRLWDVATGWLVHVLEGHKDVVRNVAFAPDGKTLASGSDDRTIRFWNVEAGRQRGVFQALGGVVNCLAFSPDGKSLAAASSDKLVTLWDLTTVIGTLSRKAFFGHPAAVRSVAFSPDGTRLASGSADKTIRLWDIEEDRLIRDFEGHANPVTSVAFSPDGKKLASGSSDFTARLWDIEAGREVRRFEGHDDSVMSVVFAPDGETLAIGSWDKTLRLWDVATGRILQGFEGHRHSVTSVAFSPDGRTLVTGSEDKTVQLWDLAIGRLAHRLVGHMVPVTSVAFSPDGRTLASVSHDNIILLWDVEKEAGVRAIIGHGKFVANVAFSPDGRTLATAFYDNSVRLFDIATGREIRAFKSHERSVMSVVFAPDGRTLASSSSDLTILLWDLLRGQTTRMFSGHSDLVTCVVFAPDGKTLVSASHDRTIRRWDIATGLEERIFRGHTDIVTSVAFAPEGKTFVSGSSDNTVRLWDIATGIATFTFHGHSAPVLSVAFSPDGRTIASASEDGTIRLWDVRTNRCLFVLLALPEGWVAFTPDGRYKLSGDIAGSFWHVAGLCRFEPGELDKYLDLRLRDRAPFVKF